MKSPRLEKGISYMDIAFLDLNIIIFPKQLLGFVGGKVAHLIKKKIIASTTPMDSHGINLELKNLLLGILN